MAVEKIVIPDFGDVQQITVVEVFISPGDSVKEEDSLVTLESEKAVMDIPSPYSGVIKEIQVKNDDVVKSGDLIALIEIEESLDSSGTDGEQDPAPDEDSGKEIQESGQDELTDSGDATAVSSQGEKKVISHATPSIRAFAREHGVDLSTVEGSGPKGRILKEDVLQNISRDGAPAFPASESQAEAAAGASVPENLRTDEEVQEIPLGRIKKISGPHLQESWTTIPHVTHFDEANISDLEAFRQDLNSRPEEDAVSFSPLVFVVKAVTAALQEFPIVNSSIAPDATSIVLKKFYHIGIAVDTPEGLVVPVIKNADRMGFTTIAQELARLSSSARKGRLSITDMQGATFTISSLGGIGGTGFTPIVNSPQAAILGLSRSFMKPVWDGERFVPRLTLPFSLSYDHRIIDGAEAARFCRALRLNLEDLKRTLL